MRVHFLLVLVCVTAALDSPGLLRKGWNLGNTLESTLHNPRAEWILEKVKSAGFDWVRIPVKWDQHAAAKAPFAVNASWMATVEETVLWAKKHGLVAMINAHHEDWLDEAGTEFQTELVRFTAIWEQVATHFSGYADTDLVFEIMNEPKKMSIDNLNDMNAAVLPVIRKTNPTRQVHFGGLAQMGPWWITSHPDAMHIPKSDKNIALTFHSYSPWSFAGGTPRNPPTVFEYTDEMAAKEDSTHQQMHAWAQQRGLRAVVVDEFGVTHFQTNRTAVLKYYAANTEAAVKNGNGYAVWDDNGWYQILNRSSQLWDTEVIQKMHGFNWCHGSPVKRDTNMNTWYDDRDARESDCDWMCSQNSKCSCSWFSTQAGGTCEQYGQQVLV